MPDSFEGGCACAAIRYVCNRKPLMSFNCHCRACQQCTVSAYRSGIAAPTGAFQRIRGEPTYYTRQADSGGDISRGFCAVCGSPVVARFSRMPDLVAIPAASLVDPSWHKPSFDMFTCSAQPWDHMHPDLPKFSEGPPQKN